jgi:Amt family ammonium transporter
MPQLDRWVFRKVLEWRTSTPGGKSDCTFAINLSGKSLSDDRLLGFISSQLESHRLPAGAICFEITETAAISDLSRVVHFMTALRQFGCTFALDDFGTGLSSFSYLKNLPVDFLKIDGHFVRNMATDEFDATAVRAISEVARSAGIKVIAEQVESEEVLQRLRQLQIDYAQGFHIGRPVPISETLFE